MLASIVPLVALCWVATVDPIAALILATSVPVLIGLMILIGKRTQAQTRNRIDALSLLSAHFLDVVRGLETLLAYRRERAQGQVLADVGVRPRPAPGARQAAARPAGVRGRARLTPGEEAPRYVLFRGYSGVVPRWWSGHAARVCSHGCNLQHKPPCHIRSLAFLEHVNIERRRDRRDANRLCSCHRDSVSPPPLSPETDMSITARRPSGAKKSWTVAVRERAVAALPPEKLLADKQPSYVSSWIYVFGVLTLASLVVLIASGSILALKGPGWWHFTAVGHFFNSLHLWSVELFFFFMVIHLWGKFWMAAWRGGRSRVWMTGAVVFLVAVPCALTGYVSQQNFDSQWISTQAKDAMNAAGVGSFFNLTNFGQMYSYHIFLLPLAVVALVGAHVLLVREHGVVPPFELETARETGASNGVEPEPLTHRPWMRWRQPDSAPREPVVPTSEETSS